MGENLGSEYSATMPLAPPPPPQPFVPEPPRTARTRSVGAAIGIGVGVAIFLSVISTFWQQLGLTWLEDLLLSDIQGFQWRLTVFNSPLSGLAGFVLHYFFARHDRWREAIVGAVVWFGAALVDAAIIATLTYLTSGWITTKELALGAVAIVGFVVGSIQGTTRVWPAPIVFGVLLAGARLSQFWYLWDGQLGGGSPLVLLAGGVLVAYALSAVALAHYEPAPFTYGGVRSGTNDHFA